MFDYDQRIQAIKEEIGGEHWKGIMRKVRIFEHLDMRKQDRFIQQMSEFPKLKSFLLECQFNHEGITQYRESDAK